MKRRLVLLVEGEGDSEAVPVLTKRLLTESQGWDSLILDPAPLIVGEFAGLVKDDCAEWLRFLRLAGKRRNVGGCLLLLDGDTRLKDGDSPFCSMRAAKTLADRARSALAYSSHWPLYSRAWSSSRGSSLESNHWREGLFRTVESE